MCTGRLYVVDIVMKLMSSQHMYAYIRSTYCMCVFVEYVHIQCVRMYMHVSWNIIAKN
jgi:hypothetical protein